jgi:PAS domain S-box-containing protein
MLYIIATLIKSEKRLKSVIDKYIISSSTDLKGVITDVSDAFCKISGYKRDELIGKPHNIIRHPDMPKSAFRDMWDTISKGKTWNGEVKNLKKDGGYYWVYANIEPLFDRYGKIEGYVAIRLDITDSVHLEEELELSKQKDKTLLHQSKLAQMGEMISIIAHQWRQPLTAISATTADLYIKNMLDQYNSDYYNEKLEKIDSLSQHLSNTIDDFRNFYKQDKEKTEILYCDIIKGAIDIIETTLQNKNIKLEIATNCKKKIYTYPNELRQVILNIIKNAEDVLLERKIENPAIYIKTYNDDTYSYLEISDNAGGIPKNIIDKIFDPYFSTKMKKDGTGLGLYMSQIIVRDHSNGDIIVTNGEDGAIFTLKIPTIKE